MQQEGVWQYSVTFVSMLNTCASVDVVEEGRCAHWQSISRCLESVVFLGSSLVETCLQNVGALRMP
jgi:hypothetical protein